VSERSKTCIHCQKPFTPRSQDFERQRYCDREECRAACKHERQNRSYRKRYKEDPAVRDASKQRVGLHRKRRKRRLRAELEATVAMRLHSSLHATFLGMAAQMCGERGCAPVELVTQWRDTGVVLLHGSG
jgi:hypothetical protein